MKSLICVALLFSLDIFSGAGMSTGNPGNKLVYEIRNADGRFQQTGFYESTQGLEDFVHYYQSMSNAGNMFETASEYLKVRNLTCQWYRHENQLIGVCSQRRMLIIEGDRIVEVEF